MVKFSKKKLILFFNLIKQKRITLCMACLVFFIKVLFTLKVLKRKINVMKNVKLFIDQIVISTYLIWPQCQKIVSIHICTNSEVLFRNSKMFPCWPSQIFVFHLFYIYIYIFILFASLPREMFQEDFGPAQNIDINISLSTNIFQWIVT